MSNKDIIVSSNKTIAKYSSSLIKRGLNLALSLNKDDLELDKKNWLKKAKKLFYESEYEKALLCLDKIINLDFNNQDYTFWQLRGRTLSELGNFEKALSSFYKTYEIAQDLDCFIELLLAEADDDYERAVFFCDAAIEIQPNNIEAWYLRSIKTFYSGNKPEEALRYINRCLSIQSEDYHFWIWRITDILETKAQILNHLEKYEKELKAYEEAIFYYDRGIDIYFEDKWKWCFFSSKDDLYNNKAVILDKLARYQEALFAYEKAIELAPDNSNYYNCKADILSKLERYEEALVFYDRALELKSNIDKTHFYSEIWSKYVEPKIWLKKGKIFNELYQYQEAINSFERTIESNPNSHEAWFGRGVAMQKSQRYYDAISNYHRALEIKPDYQEAKFNIMLLELDLINYS